MKQLWQNASARSGSGLELYVTRHHTQWLDLPERERIYSDEARAFREKFEAGGFLYDRHDRYSPSSIGKCQRRVLFGYAGAPEGVMDLESQEMAEMGKVMHMRWQMEGITRGWIAEPEAWVHDGFRMGGSLDAILADDSIFELKTAHPRKYDKIVADQQAPTWEHILQVHGYFRVTGRSVASIVYQDRGSGATHEFRINAMPRAEDELDAILESLDGYVDLNALPEMLEDCKMHTGYVYRQCPFRQYCPTATKVAIG